MIIRYKLGLVEKRMTVWGGGKFLVPKRAEQFPHIELGKIWSLLDHECVLLRHKRSIPASFQSKSSLIRKQPGSDEAEAQNS